MIAYIKGILEAVEEDSILLERGGVGFEVKVPASVRQGLPSLGEPVRVHTYLYVREDILQLYGFLTKDDLEVFKKLLTVGGIGPKGALGILSSITPDDLRFAVFTEDVDAISKAPGIGKKTAAKLILELRDKFPQKAFPQGEAAGTPAEGDLRGEAVAALVSLGYSASEASQAVRQAAGAETLEELVKASLKQLSIL
ncbi:Holliday junction branch migration protein RuvA [Anaerotalea alkaliphila]|uniref:Holliday junction branch migration complex subunit RuvA n=1 Tax=Anaerotalea alkaliphila TaxID=2662126 RepID=A0A7X5HXF2_9FIRM|nr:Holliday junction branch migration protein RuvA [Anaerotalea alkaliphila]NDL68439.1 Holliday junction branch migration protein RuvA [Anaerotalea alkaliphila]